MIMSSAKEIVQQFFSLIRSGKALEQVDHFMHNSVIAHQIQSEDQYSIERTPQQYAEHVLEMCQEYGNFQLEIQEMIADGNKVYVRWKQTSQHTKIKPVIEIASAVYLVESGKIAEYWIQIDRKGIEIQLEN